MIYAATSTVSVHYGYGQHYAKLSESNAEKALMWNMISFIFGIISFAIPKLAIAALLGRLLNPTFWQKVIMWSLTGMVTAIAIANIIIYLTQCKPVEGLFKPLMVESGAATCRDIMPLIHFATFNGGARLLFNHTIFHSSDNNYVSLAFSAFVDLYLAIYPGYILFHLQMSLRKRIALSAALGLGSVYVSLQPFPLLVDSNESVYLVLPRSP